MEVAQKLFGRPMLVAGVAVALVAIIVLFGAAVNAQSGSGDRSGPVEVCVLHVVSESESGLRDPLREISREYYGEPDASRILDHPENADVFRGQRFVRPGDRLCIPFLTEGHPSILRYIDRIDPRPEPEECAADSFIFPTRASHIIPVGFADRIRPPSHTERFFYKGVQIQSMAFPHETRIRATSSGCVVHVASFSRDGDIVIIEHRGDFRIPSWDNFPESRTNRVFSAYLHIDADVSVGDTVETGQVIGVLAADVSMREGPHLRFEIREWEHVDSLGDWTVPREHRGPEGLLRIHPREAGLIPPLQFVERN